VGAQTGLEVGHGDGVVREGDRVTRVLALHRVSSVMVLHLRLRKTESPKYIFSMYRGYRVR
jgi:hypothetical protein